MFCVLARLTECRRETKKKIFSYLEQDKKGILLDHLLCAFLLILKQIQCF